MLSVAQILSKKSFKINLKIIFLKIENCTRPYFVHYLSNIAKTAHFCQVQIYKMLGFLVIVHGMFNNLIICEQGKMGIYYIVFTKYSSLDILFCETGDNRT